jgi:hypothetical protein
MMGWKEEMGNEQASNCMNSEHVLFLRGKTASTRLDGEMSDEQACGLSLTPLCRASPSPLSHHRRHVFPSAYYCPPFKLDRQQQEAAYSSEGQGNNGNTYGDVCFRN